MVEDGRQGAGKLSCGIMAADLAPDRVTPIADAYR